MKVENPNDRYVYDFWNVKLSTMNVTVIVMVIDNDGDDGDDNDDDGDADDDEIKVELLFTVIVMVMFIIIIMLSHRGVIWQCWSNNINWVLLLYSCRCNNFRHWLSAF